MTDAPASVRQGRAAAPAAAPGQPQAPPAAGGAPPMPPGFPPGVDPATYRIDEVTALLQRAAYFPLFNVHDPEKQNVVIPMPGQPNTLAGIQVNENTHRFDILVSPPVSCGPLRAANLFGQLQASVHIDWLVIPDDFQAEPTVTPPLTGLDPTRSQRFTMMNGEFLFLDQAHSGMRAFGSGRTFPTMVAGKGRLDIGAAIVMLEGLGRLAGLQGAAVVNGYIVPPQDLFINVMLRVMDPGGRLVTQEALTPLETLPDPDPTSAFMTFLGETDPEQPTRLITAADGTMLGSEVHELLRLVAVSSDLGSWDRGVRTQTRVGQIVGKLATVLSFDPLNPAHTGSVESPIPVTTRNGIFTFFGAGGGTVGTVAADLVEGRAFTSTLPGAPGPIFRFVGFGPILRGSGAFDGASGMLSLNGAVSVFPRTLSNLYVLRFVDLSGRYRAALY